MPPPSLPRELVARARLETLNEELAVVSAPHARALLELELGALYEHAFGDRAQALSRYRSAHERQPALLAPLLSIARVTRSEPALAAEAWEALAQHSEVARDRADALCEAGVLFCDELGDEARGRALFQKALEIDPTCSSAALLLEYQARAARDAKEAERALALHARAAGDVEIKASLLLELAAVDRREGRGASALARLAEASVLGAHARAVWSATERVARAQRRPERVLAALDALAARTEQAERDQSEAGQPNERPRSAALLRQAARVAAGELDDLGVAAERQARALAQAARDPLVLWERVILQHARAQPEDAIRAARTLLEIAGESPLSAAVHLRYAELLDAIDDPEAALAQLRLAALRDPGSAAATAALEDALLRMGRPQLLCDHLLVRAERTSGQARAEHLLHAGRIAVFKLRDAERGLSLLRRAAECAAQPEAALRALYVAAVWSGDHDAAVDAAQALCGRQLDPKERVALRYDQYERLRRAGDTDSALGLLEAALLEPSNATWAAPAARVEGAARHNHRLLADAHRSLSRRSPEPAHAAAHLCAAARSLLRAGEAAAAIAELRGALGQAPDDAYALALLEECLISAGEGREAARMLRDAAQTHESARRRELALLHAGGAAEAAFDHDAAARSYLEAAALDGSTAAPLWSLRRLAERGGDSALLSQALERLAAHEERTRGPGLAQLELAELLSARGEFARASAALERLLHDGELGPAAALDLWLLPIDAATREARAHAERVLLEASAALRAPLLRERLARRGGEGDAGANGDALDLDKALDEYPDDRWLAQASLAAAADGSARARAYLRLASTSDDASAAAELTLHAIRAALIAEGGKAGAECALRALEAMQRVPGSLSAATALDETLWAGDDPDARSDALAGRMAHASPEGVRLLFPARARALLAAGRAHEAADAARRMLAVEPDDLAALELLRTAARAIGDFGTVADAARRLAAHAEGRHRARLLEEAGDAFERSAADGAGEGAEQCWREAFEHDPGARLAFDELHDALLDRPDMPGLVALLERRIAAITDAAELLDLRYERALALRATGRKADAVAALDEVLVIDPTHAAALGLLVETCTALEDWTAAVSALRRLAEAPVPLAHKRVARLGAAEFLERRLDDPAGACDELRALVAAGVDDHAVLMRMASLCERASLFRDAVDAYRKAATQVSGAAAAEIELRCGDLLDQRLGAQHEAEGAYARALSADPLAVDAYTRLLSRTEDAREREPLIAQLERAARAALEREPAEPRYLRLLLRAARWSGRPDVELSALSALAALDASDAGERAALQGTLDTVHAKRVPASDAPIWQRLGNAAAHAALARPAQVLAPALAAIDGDAQQVPAFALAAELARAGDSAQRYDLGREALARSLGVWPLARRTRAEKRDALRACLVLAGRAAPTPAIDALAKQLGDRLSRAQRKELVRAFVGVSDAAAEAQFDGYLDALETSLVRAGVLLAADVGAAWRRGTALSGSAHDLELLRFWLSPRALELLREMWWGA
jgi:tetratricopeptide (TPR) repeat protein